MDKKYSFNTLSNKLKTDTPVFSKKEYQALKKSFAKPKRNSDIKLDDLKARFHALQLKDGPNPKYSISNQNFTLPLSSSTGAAESPAVETPQSDLMKSTILPLISSDPIIFDKQDSNWALQYKSQIVRANQILPR